MLVKSIKDFIWDRKNKTKTRIGGPAAILAQDNIKKVDVLEYAELGMEAIWKIEVEDFPAFIVVDDKGNDFFDEFLGK
jgi:fumarate hydratase, class I